MKWTTLYSAVVAMIGMVGTANAGSIVLTSHNCCGAEKSCGCAPSCQPKCCRPVIYKPCCPHVHNYQRTCAKPMSCCNTCPGSTCAPKCCAPAPAPTCAAPAPATCAAPCAPKCAPAPAPTCAAPCAPAPATCAAPCAPKCAPAPTCAAPAPATCCAPAPAPTCCAPAPAPAPAKCCDAPCQSKCCDTGCKTKCCNADPCEVAHWIYESQTGCHAKDRRKALRKLGKFDCVCNPEIMCAFIYGLNDCDHKVRKQAAIQIRKQTKKNCCCCNDKVVCALTYALGDCDKGVVRAASRALKACGYDVQKSCCESGCNTCCTQPASCSAPGQSVVPTPAEGGEAAPAPAPAPASAEPEAYFPSRLKSQQTKARKSGLANLFGVRG